MADQKVNYLLGISDFNHLIRGGTLKVGDNQIALDDVGFTAYQTVFHEATVERVTKSHRREAEWSTVGEVRVVD
jgi:hypothetical protein